MPFSFYLAIICLLVAIVAGIVWFFVKDEEAQLISAGSTAIAGVLAIVFVITASANVVGTRQIGIVTTFGRPTGETLSNGLHWLAPWKEVNEMDGAIQNDVYRGDNRILVRLGNQSTANADVNIRWQIKQGSADELFQQYKTFDNVRSNLIERNLRVALNEAFASYDPLAVNNIDKSPLPAIGDDALNRLRSKVGNQVEIVDVSVPTIDFDDTTEQRINQINEERANTTKAEQEIKTNDAKRKAAEQLANMPAPDLRIAIANCVNKMAQSGTNLSCFPIGQGVLPTVSIPNPAG